MRHIDDHIEALRRHGAETFRQHFPWHVLLGLSVVGDLDDEGTRGEEQTFLAELSEQEHASQSLRRRVWPIRKSPYGPETRSVLLGRLKEGNDMVVPDYSISTTHCEFVQVRRQIMIQDRRSHNGTFVRGERLEPDASGVILSDQDTIVLGRFKFEYLTSATLLERLENMAALAHRLERQRDRRPDSFPP